MFSCTFWRSRKKNGRIPQNYLVAKFCSVLSIENDKTKAAEIWKKYYENINVRFLSQPQKISDVSVKIKEIILYYTLVAFRIFKNGVRLLRLV